jgi:hypothetical protein
MVGALGPEFGCQSLAQGFGVIARALLMAPDDLLEKLGFIVAGTPAECKRGCEEIMSHLKKYDFDHIAVGVPLGPNVPEALGMIGREIMPLLQSSFPRGA